MRWTVTILALLSAGAASAAPAIPEPVREAASAYYDQSWRWGRSSGDQPKDRQRAPDEVFLPLDISHDGVADWLVDFGRGRKPNGYLEGWYEIYVSRPDGGHALVFEGRMHQPRWSVVAGETVLDARLNVLFGEPDRRLAWDEALGQLVERPNRRGNPFLIDGPVTLRRMDFDGRWPDNRLVRFATGARQTISTQIHRRAVICSRHDADADFLADQARFTETPDLNGDGVRDWIFGAFRQECSWTSYVDGHPPDPPLPFTILVSRPDGGFDVAWDKPIDSYWALDLSTRPARVLLLKGSYPCPYQVKGCVEASLRWTGTAFEPAPDRR